MQTIVDVVFHDKMCSRLPLIHDDEVTDFTLWFYRCKGNGGTVPPHYRTLTYF